MPLKGFSDISTNPINRLEPESLNVVFSYKQSPNKQTINVPVFSNRHLRKNHYRLDNKFVSKVKGYLNTITEKEDVAITLFGLLSGCSSKMYTLFLKDVVDDTAKAMFFERLLRHNKKCFSKQVMNSSLFGEIGFEDSNWYFRSFNWYFLFGRADIIKNVFDVDGHYKMPTPTFYKYLAEMEQVGFVKVGNSYKPTKIKQIKRKGKVIEKREQGYSCVVYPTISLLRFLAPALCKILYKQLKNDKYIKKVFINDEDLIKLYTIDWQAYLVSKEQETKKIAKNQYKKVYKEVDACTSETLSKDFIKEFAYKNCGYSNEYSEKIANFKFLKEEELKKLSYKEKAQYHQFRRYFYRVLDTLKEYDANTYDYVKVRYNVTARGKIKKTISGRVSPTPTAVRQKKELTKDVMTLAGMKNSFDIDCDLFYTTYVRKYGVEPVFKDKLFGTHNHVIKHIIEQVYNEFCKGKIITFEGKDIFAVSKAKTVLENGKNELLRLDSQKDCNFVNGYWTNQFGQQFNNYQIFGSTFKKQVLKSLFECSNDEKVNYFGPPGKYTFEQYENLYKFFEKYSSKINQTYIKYTAGDYEVDSKYFEKFSGWVGDNKRKYEDWCYRFSVDATKAVNPFLERASNDRLFILTAIDFYKQLKEMFERALLNFLYKKCKKLCAAQYRAYFEPNKKVMKARLLRNLREEAIKIGHKDEQGRPILDASDLFFLEVAMKTREWLEYHKLFLDVPAKGFMITSSASYYTTAKIRELGYKCVNKYDEYWSDCPQDKLSKLVKRCYKEWSYTLKKSKVPIYN